MTACPKVMKLVALTMCVAAWVLAGRVMAQEPLKTTAAPPEDAKMQLFLLIGQSNMSGRGKIEAEDQVPHPRVWNFTKDEQWVPAVDPLHFDKPKVAGVGLGTTFGKTVADAQPEVHVGLIPCAVGGTPIARWVPGGDLFEEAVRRAKVAQQHGEIAGILWHQGENDSRPERIAVHAEQLEKVVKGFRDALNAPDAPFILGQLSRARDEKSPGNAPMNEVLTRFPETHSNTVCVSSEGLSHTGDRTHFDAAGLREFGKRYADAYFKLVDATSDTPTTKPSK